MQTYVFLMCVLSATPAYGEGEPDSARPDAVPTVEVTLEEEEPQEDDAMQMDPVEAVVR